MRMRPVFQAAACVDVAQLAHVFKRSTPGGGHAARALQAAKRVIAGGQQHALKRQALQPDSPAWQHLADVLTRRIWWGDQQGGFDQMRVFGMRRPGRHRHAAQTVRHQHGGLGIFVVVCQQHVFKPRNPVAAQRALPVVLLNPLVAMCEFPAALPMLGAAVLPAGQDENVLGVHAGLDVCSVFSSCSRAYLLGYRPF